MLSIRLIAIQWVQQIKMINTQYTNFINVTHHNHKIEVVVDYFTPFLHNKTTVPFLTQVSYQKTKNNSV